jgi:hypothetical protein
LKKLFLTFSFFFFAMPFAVASDALWYELQNLLQQDIPKAEHTADLRFIAIGNNNQLIGKAHISGVGDLLTDQHQVMLDASLQGKYLGEEVTATLQVQMIVGEVFQYLRFDKVFLDLPKVFLNTAKQQQIAESYGDTSPLAQRWLATTKGEVDKHDFGLAGQTLTGMPQDYAVKKRITADGVWHYTVVSKNPEVLNAELSALQSLQSVPVFSQLYDLLLPGKYISKITYNPQTGVLITKDIILAQRGASDMRVALLTIESQVKPIDTIFLREPEDYLVLPTE